MRYYRLSEHGSRYSLTDHVGTSRLDTKVVVWAALPTNGSEVLVQKRISEKNKYSFSKIIVTIFADE